MERLNSCPYGGADDEQSEIILSTNQEYTQSFAINALTGAANMSRVTNNHESSRFNPWFWPDAELQRSTKLRQALFLDNQDTVLHTGNNDTAIHRASQTLLGLQSNYLADTFPEQYTITHDPEFGDIIINKTTDDQFSIHPTEDDWHPLAISGMLGQEDICLMQKTKKDTYKLVAGFLATPTHWALSDFVGADMDKIHKGVAGYHKQAKHSRVRLKDTVDKALSDLPEYPSRQVVRNNILIEFNGALALPHGANTKVNIKQIKKDIGNLLYIRSERETLTRLPSPDNDFIVFTIKEHVFPVTALAKSIRRDQLLRALRTNTELRGVVENRKLLEPLTDYLAGA